MQGVLKKTNIRSLLVLTSPIFLPNITYISPIYSKEKPLDFQVSDKIQTIVSMIHEFVDKELIPLDRKSVV